MARSTCSSRALEGAVDKGEDGLSIRQRFLAWERRRRRRGREKLHSSSISSIEREKGGGVPISKGDIYES